MPYDPDKHDRQSIRLPHWDYRRPGAYFITACTHERRWLFGEVVAGSLSTIMRQFKSMVTKRINRMRGAPGEPVWQRNFYERIVRNRRALGRIRTYIRQNPARWHRDRHRPDG